MRKKTSRAPVKRSSKEKNLLSLWGAQALCILTLLGSAFLLTRPSVVSWLKPPTKRQPAGAVSSVTHILERTAYFMGVSTGKAFVDCRISRNPAACNQSLEGLKSPTGMILFESGAAGTNFLIQKGLGKLAQKGLPGTAHFLQRYIGGYLGMAGGSSLMDLYSELSVDPHARKAYSKIADAIANGDEATDWHAINMELWAACQNTFCHDGWVAKQGKHFMGLVTASILSGVATRMGKNVYQMTKKGALKWRYGQVAKRWKSRGLGKCYLPQLEGAGDAFFLAAKKGLGSRAASFAGRKAKGALKYAASTSLFLHIAGMVEDGLLDFTGVELSENMRNEAEVRDELEGAYFDLDDALAIYASDRNTANLAVAVDRIFALQRTFHAYRQSEMHEPEKQRAAYVEGVLNALVGENEKISMAYRWLVEGMPEEGDEFETIISSLFPYEEHPIVELRELASDHADAFFCGVDPKDPIQFARGDIPENWGALTRFPWPFKVTGETLGSVNPHVVPYRVASLEDSKKFCALTTRERLEELAEHGDKYKTILTYATDTAEKAIVPTLSEYTDRYIDLFRESLLEALNGPDKPKGRKIVWSKSTRFLPASVYVSKGIIPSFQDEIEFWGDVMEQIQHTNLNLLEPEIQIAINMVHLLRYEATRLKEYIDDPKNFELRHVPSEIAQADKQTIEQISTNWAKTFVMKLPKKPEGDPSGIPQLQPPEPQDQ